ncbi:RNA polymerase sigma-70 factor [Wenyingzhuangia sp. IMCC45533]
MKERKIEKIRTIAYDEAYNSLYSSLCVFSNRYVYNIEKSKDLVQDVFIRLWNHDILEKDKEAIKAFLYIAVRNKSLDYLKSKEYKIKRDSESLDITALETDSYFEKEVFIEEMFRQVDTALATLPEKCREVVKLSMQGYPNNQISEELSISLNTVKMQKRIAYKKLRPLLKDYYLIILLPLIA